jgi:DNA-directed RNA polymerase subunit RPC12/RpoP
MNAGLLLFLQSWKIWMQFGAVASIALSVLVVLFYFIRLLAINDLKAKYDFVNLNEINYLMIGGYLLVISGWFYLNSLFGDKVQVEAGIFIARLLGTLIFASIFLVVVYNLLKIYYPSVLEKKLHRLRYTPRKSPKTGKSMKLLSEEEEDVYLTEGMQAEEEVFSVDYDVWVDEESNYTKIEKYDGHLHAEKCESCNFQTLKVVKEEILTSPTTNDKGELMKYYECTYCGHKTRRLFTIGRIKIAENVEPSTA